jgi:hypothetical protein
VGGLEERKKKTQTMSRERSSVPPEVRKENGGVPRCLLFEKDKWGRCEPWALSECFWGYARDARPGDDSTMGRCGARGRVCRDYDRVGVWGGVQGWMMVLDVR